MLLYIIQREDHDAYHQRHIPDFPHTLLSAYLCHADVTISPLLSVQIVSLHKLYLHYKSLPRAPQTQPHTTSTHTWNTATLIFISIFDNYISKPKRGAPRGVEGGGAQGGAPGGVLGGANWRKMSKRRMPLFSAVGALDEATLLYCTHWLNDMAQDHLLTAI